LTNNLCQSLDFFWRMRRLLDHWFGMSGLAWTYSRFRLDILNADLDQRINILESLAYFLDGRQVLDLAEDEYKFLLEQTQSNAVLDQGADPIQVSMLHSWANRCLVSLSTRVPLNRFAEWLPLLIGKMLDEPNETQSELVSVVKEILLALLELGESGRDRQTAAKDQLFTRLLQKTQVVNVDTVRYALELLTELTANLGSTFTPDNIEKITSILKQFTATTTREYSYFQRSFPVLAVAWSDLKVTDNAFASTIEHLLKGIPAVPAAELVLVALIRHNAARFSGFIDRLIDLFYGPVLLLLGEEEDLSREAVESAQHGLYVLDSLISAFPNYFDETISYYTDVALPLLGYGGVDPLASSDYLDIEVAGDEEDVPDNSVKMRRCPRTTSRASRSRFRRSAGAGSSSRERRRPCASRRVRGARRGCGYRRACSAA
jgi:hypothetical protein